MDLGSSLDLAEKLDLSPKHEHNIHQYIQSLGMPIKQGFNHAVMYMQSVNM